MHADVKGKLRRYLSDTYRSGMIKMCAKNLKCISVVNIAVMQLKMMKNMTYEHVSCPTACCCVSGFFLGSAGTADLYLLMSR